MKVVNYWIFLCHAAQKVFFPDAEIFQQPLSTHVLLKNN